MDDNRAIRGLLRHAIATLAYRASKVLRGAPSEFARFDAGKGSRTPGDIVAHMGDLFDWALTMAKGTPVWSASAPQTWDGDVYRFFAALAALDAYLASDAPLGITPERLLQAPVADGLTHVGQLAMLRRLCGAPIRGESYFDAAIAAGQTGAEQPAPRVEFG